MSSSPIFFLLLLLLLLMCLLITQWIMMWTFIHHYISSFFFFIVITQHNPTIAMSSSHHLFFLEDTTAHPRTNASPLRLSPAVRTQACRNLLRVETKGEWNQSSRSSTEVVATATPYCWVRILHWPPVAFPSVFLIFLYSKNLYLSSCVFRLEHCL